jgi:hypothetical protein
MGKCVGFSHGIGWGEFWHVLDKFRLFERVIKGFKVGRRENKV